MTLNIKQIAELAGVAPSTVSRATNPRTRKMLSEETLARIDALVKKHGYVPSIAARQLKNPGAMKIGVLLPYYPRMFFHAYYVHVIAGIADALMDTDYSFRLILLKPRRKKWTWYDFQIGEGVEGVIVTHWQSFFSSRFLSKSGALPHVLINDLDDTPNSWIVSEDSESGGRLAAENLYDNGHRNVAIITGGADSCDSARRVSGFTAFWKEKNLAAPSLNIFAGDFGGGDSVNVAVDEILALDKRPTAIFACNDSMALAACQRLKEKGLSCPGDISIIGYDNTPESAVASPGLTTIHQPLYELAAESTRILVNYLSEGDRDKPLSGSTLLPVTLVERGSVKKISLQDSNSGSDS